MLHIYPETSSMMIAIKTFLDALVLISLLEIHEYSTHDKTCYPAQLVRFC